VSHQETRHALGSEAVLTIVASTQAQAEYLVAALWEQIDSFEARFSRFRPDSELSRVNALAGAPQQLSPEFAVLLSAALALSKETEGAYDPTMLPALQRGGYIGSWPTPAEHDPRLDLRQRQGSGHASVELSGRVLELPPDMALDLGGIGKGYLLDQLADYLGHKALGYCLSLGGDIVVGGLGPDGGSWSIAVASAYDDAVMITNHIMPPSKRRAIATSGVIRRRGGGGAVTGAPEWHHLIDPLTGQPGTTDLASVTVACDSATRADVIAKTVLLSGSAAAPALAERLGAELVAMQMLRKTLL
jgi:FAD:protein FMN transferase